MPSFDETLSEFEIITEEEDNANESEFEMVAAPWTTSKTVSGPKTLADVKNYRFSPTLLNNLILSYIEGQLDDQQVEEGSIKTKRGLSMETYYKKLSKTGNAPVFVFQTVRDVKNSTSLGNNCLAFANDVIEAFLTKNPRQNGKFLIPVAQSRAFRRHYVLAEVRIEGKIKEITIYNSKSKWSSNIMYPNSFNDLRQQGFSVKTIYYDQQHDNISCGFFVYSYIVSILKRGNASQLADLSVTLYTLISNPTLLPDTLNANFSANQRIVRKIADYNMPLSWEKTELSKQLDEKYEENMNRSEKEMEAFPSVEVEAAGRCPRPAR